MSTRPRPTARQPIDFVVRSDAFSKPGGDTHQVDQYREVLERLGYDVRLMEYRGKLSFRPGSLVHIVNVDRPYDFLATIRMARDHKVVVSPIHHDLRWVREMRRAETGQGLRSIAGRCLSESGREFLAFAVRSFHHINSLRSASTWLLQVGRAAAHMPRVWRSAGRVLDDVHAVTLLARGEGAALAADTGWSGDNAVVIPNGIPEQGKLQRTDIEWADRTIDVCVVGRIEPRKRSLEVAKAASKLGIKCVFVGPASPTSRAYAAAFSSYASESPHVNWLGPRSHSEVQSLLRTSKVLVNASWVEVQSLVDIEAVRSGCWVITGRGGNSGEWMAGRLITVDTHDVDKIMSTVAVTLNANIPPSGSLYSQTWDATGRALAAAYESGNPQRGQTDRPA